jgi:transposase
MASIQPRVSRGKKYWSIVESRRVNGKPRTVILEYLGTADTLLERLQQGRRITLKSYTHGDCAALLSAAIDLGIVNTINKYVPTSPAGNRPKRDGLTIGASLLLAAIGRACRPTSKLGWYDWCKKSSLEYSLSSSFKKLDSQHFWDQMHALPVEAIAQIEEEIAQKLWATHQLTADCLFFDTTNFFTFIDSANEHCELPRRGRNKQKRFDLRQVGMALLVSKDDQFPLFHRTYQGNKNDMTVFNEVFHSLVARMRKLSKELADVTIVFDKGNNSKDNFKLLDGQSDLHYVGGLVPSYFKSLIQEANKHFSEINIDNKTLPAYRTQYNVWGKLRTCVVTISEQLKKGQVRGIHQHLRKKYIELESFKKQLEQPKGKKLLMQDEIESRLKKIIRGQFIEDILQYEIFKIEGSRLSFTYHIDSAAFENLQRGVLGRQIIVTNRHDWTSEQIIQTYHGQSKIEYANRCLKNPFHCAVRPQYHWTDQKIEVHFLICIIAYLLATSVYSKAKRHAAYQRNISNLLEDLQSLRLVCLTGKKSRKVNYQLEQIPENLKQVAKVLGISNQSIRPTINLSDYTPDHI